MQEKVKKKKNRLTARLEKRDVKVSQAYLERVLVELAYVGIAYVFGNAKMLFDTSPLGLALLCAGRGHILSILVGLILSAFFLPTLKWVYLVMYLVTAVVRIVSGIILDAPDGEADLNASVEEKLNRMRTYVGEEEKITSNKNINFKPVREENIFNRIRKEFGILFGERIRLRMATAAVCSLIVSLYRVIVGGFTYYDWFATLFCVLVVPAAVMVYSVYLDQRSENKWMYTISGAVLLFSLIWSSVGLWIGSFPLSLMLAFFFTLYACMIHGTVQGSLAGLLCGLAIRFSYAPAFLFAALIFSQLQNKKKHTAGIFSAVLCALIWLLYVDGVSQIPIILPPLLIAGATFTPVCVYLHAKEATEDNDIFSVAESNAVRRRFIGEQYESANAHLRGISEAFSTLSEMFYNLSDRFRRPGTLDLRCICDRVFDAHCADCPNKTVCWGLEYPDTLDTVNKLISRLHTRGNVTKEQFPAHLIHRCNLVDVIIEEINRDCARLTGELLRNNRTEIFAMDYEGAAKIINDALEEDAGEYCFDPELEQKVTEYLRDAGVKVSSVTVYGQRRRQILARGVDVEYANVTAETMRADLGEMCGMHLGQPIFEVDTGVSTMLLQARKKISVLGAQNNISADGGVSGDTVNLFSNKKDYFYGLINDGMGSGKEAAFTSSLCSVFLEKMLRAGNRANTSLRMLNNMIRSRASSSAGECSATVDLLELDLMTAEASFIKSGAAPSFVVRGGTVHRLQSGTAPIGILGNLDAQIKHYKLRPGDTVVMISDGIEQNDPDLKWLSSYLTTCGECTPEEIVYCICLHAAESDNRDDCSAIALRILSAEEEQ